MSEKVSDGGDDVAMMINPSGNGQPGRRCLRANDGEISPGKNSVPLKRHYGIVV